MEQLGFAGFALAFLAGIWWLARLMTSVSRNDDRSPVGSRGNGPGF